MYIYIYILTMSTYAYVFSGTGQLSRLAKLVFSNYGRDLLIQLWFELYTVGCYMTCLNIRRHCI